jgi:energy-coupling factor transporter transmembrane protein EcfT
MHESDWLRLHPAARILSLALLTILLARLQWPGLLLAAGPLVWLLSIHPELVVVVFRLVKRLRWFFLSILILFIWFTPGSPAIHTDGSTPIMGTGLMMGLQRILALIIVVGYSGLLLRLSSRAEIITGIYTLLTPLKKLGVDSGKLAVRLGLVLEYVPRFEEMQQSIADRNISPAQETSWLDRSALLFNAAMNPPAPEGAQTGTIELPDTPHVSVLDLLLPALLATLIFVL